MRLTPQTEQQINKANVLLAGTYGFQVQVAEEKTSKKGNPMIVVQLEVYDEDGKGRKITDYLMESIAYKLRHFAYAVGLGARYEAGELSASEMQGLSGKCIIKIDPPKDQYASKNSVKDYINTDATVAHTPVANGIAAGTDPTPF